MKSCCHIYEPGRHHFNEHIYKLPAKSLEGNRDNKSLNPESRAQSMKSSIIFVTISRRSDGKPIILGIKYCERNCTTYWTIQRRTRGNSFSNLTSSIRTKKTWEFCQRRTILYFKSWRRRERKFWGYIIFSTDHFCLNGLLQLQMKVLDLYWGLYLQSQKKDGRKSNSK